MATLVVDKLTRRQPLKIFISGTKKRESVFSFILPLGHAIDNALVGAHDAHQSVSASRPRTGVFVVK